jgi:hypothetical protein
LVFSVYFGCFHFKHLNAFTPNCNLCCRKKLVPLQRKIEVRERRREAKALIAARLDTAIEKQLVERLRKGVVRNFFNFSVLF